MHFDVKRLNKQLAMRLISLLENHPSIRRRRSTGIPANIKVLIALDFYASGSYQRTVGNDYLNAASQPTVSKIIKK